jgi:hypothetical protein
MSDARRAKRARNGRGTRVADEARMIERTLFIASFALAGCASAAPVQKPTASISRPQEERHVYRLDFLVVANEPGKPAQSSAYTMNLEDYDNGEIHLGSNVQLTPQARQDVGLKIKASVASRGDDVLLHDAVELSGIDEPQTIHKLTTSGDAYLHAGQQTLVASLEDPLSHKRYQVSAQATRLR